MKKLFCLSAFMVLTISMISCTADDATNTDVGNKFTTQGGGDEGGIPIPPPPPPKPPVK